MEDLEPTLRRTAAILGLVVAVGVGAVLFYSAFFFVLLVFAALLLAVFLTGSARWVRRNLFRETLGFGWALAAVCLSLLFVLYLGGRVTGPPLVEQSAELMDRIPGAIEDLGSWLESTGWGSHLLRRMNSGGGLGQPRDLVGRVTGFFSTGLGIVANTLVVVTLGIYLAVDHRETVDGAVKLAPPGRRSRVREVLGALRSGLFRWTLGRLASMTVVGVLTAVGLQLLGMPLVLSLSILAGALAFIPFLGPVLAAIPAILVGYMHEPMMAIWVAVLYTAIQQFEGATITPMIQRQAVQMPPALLITAQILLGLVAGLLGVLLATPLAVVTVILVQMLYLEGILGEEVEPLGS